MAALTEAPKFYQADSNGDPLVGGKVYTYLTNTSTPKATYTNAGGGTPNTNPVILDSAGRANIWLATDALYRFEVYDADDALVYGPIDSIGASVPYSALSASTGSSLLTWLQAGTGAVARTVQSKLRDTFSVKDFGAVGDGATDDTAAIQACITAAHAAFNDVFFPQGTYKITSALTLSSNMRIYGVGGFQGSMLRQFTANTAIFTYATIEDVEIDHLCFFTGSASGVTAINQTDLTGYTQQAHVHHCHFYADLRTCISVNLILSQIGPFNTFGYYGTPGVSLSHIVALGGGGGNTSNINRVWGNRFWNARGAGVGVSFDNGFLIDIELNEFSGSSVQPLTIAGMSISHVRYNWFENNNFTSCIGYSNGTVGGSTNLINVVEGNFAAVHASTTSFIAYSGSGVVGFRNNRGTGWGACLVTNSADGFVGEYYNNALTGYAGTLVNRLLLGALLDAGGTQRIEITTDGRLILAAGAAQLQTAEGASVAAANDLTLGTDGNAIIISGNTQINRLNASAFSTGGEVMLVFTGTPTVKHDQGASGGLKPIMLAGAVDFVASANDTLTLSYVPSLAKWYEKSRAVI